MVEFIRPQKGNIISLRTKGKISSEEIKKVEELIEAKSVSYPKLRMYAVVEDFEGYDSVSSLWKDLRVSSDYLDKFERASIVTSKDWVQKLSNMADRVTDVEIKVFDGGTRSCSCLDSTGSELC